MRPDRSFKTVTWNIFASGIPERVWLLPGCLEPDKNRPQVSTGAIQLFLSPFSFFPSLSLNPSIYWWTVCLFSLSAGACLNAAQASQPGNLWWPLLNPCWNNNTATSITLSTERWKIRIVIISVTISKNLIKNICWTIYLLFTSYLKTEDSRFWCKHLKI